MNSMKKALKAAGVFRRTPVVASSDINLKPVNKIARIVTAKRPWWADPVTESRNVLALETEIRRLSEALANARKQLGKSNDANARLRSQLEAANTEIESLDRARVHSQNLIAQLSAQLGKAHEAIRSFVR